MRIRDRDGKNSDPGSLMEKLGSGIRDKHPGPTTLILQEKITKNTCFLSPSKIHKYVLKDYGFFLLLLLSKCKP